MYELKTCVITKYAKDLKERLDNLTIDESTIDTENEEFRKIGEDINCLKLHLSNLEKDWNNFKNKLIELQKNKHKKKEKSSLELNMEIICEGVNALNEDIKNLIKDNNGPNSYFNKKAEIARISALVLLLKARLGYLNEELNKYKKVVK